MEVSDWIGCAGVCVWVGIVAYLDTLAPTALRLQSFIPYLFHGRCCVDIPKAPSLPLTTFLIVPALGNAGLPA